MKVVAVVLSIMIAMLGQCFAQPVMSGADIKESCRFVVEGAKTEFESGQALHCMGL